MQRIATDVAYNVVCVLSTWVSCAKMGEPIKMPFGGGLIYVGPRNYVVDGVKI